jgi:MATE family multidrug resistance protein
MGLCDRLILARYSLEALEGCVSALYLSQLFQLPCVRVASIAQVFVGQYRGSKELNKIGPCIWQMIWFSILSMCITWPLSVPIGSLFFQNTAVQENGTLYFQCLMALNFLFPLGAALSSFYLGQGQMKMILFASLASHIVNILLDFLLIFGIDGLFSPLGTLGAAIATGISQSLFCSILFYNFLNTKNRQLYSTPNFHFDLSSFWKCLQIGLPRAGTKIILFTAWVAITHIMIRKGGNYLAILAFGGSLTLFFSCLNEGLSQALITIGAYIVGAKRYKLMWKLARSACLFLSFWTLLIAIPCLLFPDNLIALFFKEPPSSTLLHELRLSCYWLLVFFLAHGLNLISLGLLTSYGDTLFQLLFGIALTWMPSFLPVYFAIELYDAPPDRLWLIMAGACLTSALTYFLRLKQEKYTMPILYQSQEITS